MREDAKKGVYVENLSEVDVKGVNDVIQLLLQVSYTVVISNSDFLLDEMNCIEQKQSCKPKAFLLLTSGSCQQESRSN